MCQACARLVLDTLEAGRMVDRTAALARRIAPAQSEVDEALGLEDGVRQTKKLMAALDRTVRRLAAFNDCGEAEWAGGREEGAHAAGGH